MNINNSAFSITKNLLLIYIIKKKLKLLKVFGLKMKILLNKVFVRLMSHYLTLIVK